MSATINSTNGHVILIDAADHESVSRYKWCVNGGYAFGWAPGPDGKKRNIALHRFLMGLAPRGLRWDHIDRNKLNNQRSNLRMVTNSRNMMNQGPHRRSTSGVSGVSYHKRVHAWQLQLNIDEVRVHFGYFHTLEAAADVRWLVDRMVWDGWVSPVQPTPQDELRQEGGK